MMTFGKNSALSDTDDARLSRIEAALPISRQGKVVYSSSSLAVPSTTAVLASGLISPSTGVANQGNAFPFVIQGNLSFVYANGNLTIYWDGSNGSNPIAVRRTDGTSVSIPKGSLSIGALSAGVQYAFAPFISVAQPQTISFAIGDSGSPRFAFSPFIPATASAKALQTQRLTSNETVTNGFIYFTMSGSGPGTSADGSNPYYGQS